MLTAFAALNLLANAWLMSAGGKRLLESEFSSSFGYAVRLTGSFGISLFPRIAIKGSGLELAAPRVRRLVARAEDYSVEIQLLPFLRREVHIESVNLRGGFLDLGAFMTADDQFSAAEPQEVSFPAVRSLSIEDFSLVFGDRSNIIVLENVQLNEFASGREARLEIKAGWFREGVEMVRAVLDGDMQIGGAITSARLTLNEMQLVFGSSEVSGLSGNWDWNQPISRISGEMNWNQGTYFAHSEIELNLGELTSGDWRAHFAESTEAPVASAQAQFILREGQLELPEVSMDWGGQHIAGAGCYRLASPPGLALILSAEALDLDAISARVPQGSADDSALPFDLSLELHVGSASYKGAKARNVQLKIGGEQGCLDSSGPAP